MSKSREWVALIGNPNSGKSSLFNILTGLRQSVGNFPGVTVDKKVGFFKDSSDNQIDLVDLPGLYSLFPNSKDEKLVADILSNESHEYHPSRIVYVIDVLQLERQLLLATQLIDMGFPLILAVNMMDLAKERNLELDFDFLSEKLGVPVIAVSARNNENIDVLKEKIAGVLNTTRKKPIHQFLEKKENDSLDFQVQDTMARYDIYTPWINKIISDNHSNQGGRTDSLDQIITHKFFGPIIFFAIMFLLFQSLFSWASYPMEIIDELFTKMGAGVKYLLGTGWISGLIADGILAGIGGVVIFIPQIFLLFLLIGVLEEIGYMSRVVYMFDGLLQRFGLNGRSIVALVSGGACAIPAIMSTRTISNWKERLITIMVTPLISCSARIPVYIVLVGFVVPDQTVAGVFNLQGLVFMGLYLGGIIAALVSAWVFKVILKTNERSFLMIELPRYKPPIWRNVFMQLKEKVWAFIWEAGKIVFFISIILWFLASYGPNDKMVMAQESAEQYALLNNLSTEVSQDLIASKRIEASYAGHLGKFIEPVIKPLGYDWKIGIALITSFAAREVFVGTMATIYSIGSSNDESTLREKMAAEINPNTGEKRFTPAVALSLLIFYLFAMQCMSTLAVTKRETNSWKWPIIQFVFMTALAYIGAFIAYNLLK